MTNDESLVFDHIGLITTEKKENDIYIEPTKVWITEFDNHPFRIEWLRYEPDSPVSGPVREKPHVAFRVDDIEAASKGMKVLLEPFDVGFAVVAFFETEDGAVVELMKYKEE
ncbi:MAG: VOC family protein [Rhodopirellula sp.]|nr:VOC family protein [Rhodopirellula sp.]